tara:strand:- start:40186 stop:44361 length:4176 start_codon:yes stop_codon:yes gene_type:complete
MLIDLDGDGRLDRIFSDYGAVYSSGVSVNKSFSGNTMDGCGMVWLRNDGTEFSDDDISAKPSSSSMAIKLPRLNWRRGDGLPQAGTDEHCSLTGQVTGLRNTDVQHLCNDYPTTRLIYRFMDIDADGLPDLVTALSYDDHLYDPAKDASWPPQFQANAPTVVDGSIGDPEGASPHGNAECTNGRGMEPERGTNNRFLMFWYRNKGPKAGFFDLTEPMQRYLPIPLSANVGASTPIESTGALEVSFGPSTFTDIDGDGFIDAIWSDGYNNTREMSVGQVPDEDNLTNLWSVHRGDGTGNFHEYPSGAMGVPGVDCQNSASCPYPWPVPDGAQVSSELSGLGVSNSQASTYSLSQLVDVNADGLVDLIYWDSPTPAAIYPSQFSRIYLNNGHGFDHVDSAWNQPKLTDDSKRAHSTPSMSAYRDLDTAPRGYYHNAEGESRYRFSDFDSDGRPDLLSRQVLGVPWDTDATDPYDPYQYPFTTPTSPTLYINPGLGTLITPDNASGGIASVPGFMDHKVALSEFEWEVTSDFIDLNGDGEPETVSANNGSGFNLWGRATGDQPLRLLNQIDNGNGGITSISYASHNDPDVAFNQSSYSVMPNHLWVVKDVTLTDSVSGTTSVSGVKYADPVWNQNSHGKWGFRGFTAIKTSGAHGVGETSGFPVTQQTYGYEKDWSGRLDETVVNVGGLVSSIARNTWNPYPLFGGTVLSYHVDKSETWNCLGSTDGSFLGYSACVGSNPTLTHDTIWSPAVSHFGGDSTQLLYYPSKRTTYGPGLNGPSEDGSKIEDSVYRVYSDATQYWASIYQVESSVVEGGIPVPVSLITSEVDTGNRYPRLKTSAGGDGTFPTEEIVREEVAGLVVAVANAKNRVAGIQATTQYDPLGFLVHPTSVSNYLGHTSTMVTDPGTGALLEARGPNPLPCDLTQHAGAETIYDGLGRPIEVYELGCSGPSGTFLRAKLSSIEYVEFSSAGPAHVITTLFLDASNSAKTIKNTTEIDGFGRTIRTELEDGSAEPLESTSEFNNRGQLVRSVGPNPSTEPGAPPTIATNYSYDELGRATSARNEVDATGVDISYRFDGENSIKTTKEVVLSGSAAETQVYIDFFGRMVKVEELAGSVYAATTYEFDGNDNVRRIIDADGIETIMEHDWLSRRKKVQRGERAWTYAYDLNGNLTVETAPNPGSAEVAYINPGVYSTSMIYDEQDRLESKMLAVRTLSQEQLNQFDAREVDYTFDCQDNLGRLCSETSGNNLQKIYVYDFAGRVIEETQEVSLPQSVVNFGAGADARLELSSRTAYTEYNLSGAVTDAWLPDGPDKASSTHVSYTYDGVGGAPDTTVYHDPSGDATRNITTSVQRNKAQRITQQVTGCLSRIWEYDDKGRVTNTSVFATGCAAQGAQ